MTADLVTTKDLRAVVKLWCSKLAVSFQRQIDAATVDEYREALADLPAWAIEESGLILKRKGGDFFPTAPRWHQVAEELVEARRREVLAQPITKEFECAQCRDSGWVEEARDDRTVCIPCSCRPRNSNYQRLTATSLKGRNEEVK